ncbi:hypothetical protein ACJW31_03G010900 [Castanea mollissima]
MRLPKVFAARGKPLHFFDICLPRTSNCSHCLGSLSENAIFLNTNQQSSSDNSSNLIVFALSIIFATLPLRVVTRILLLCEPQFFSASLNGFHSAWSSVHTSSKTRKNFLPLINSQIFSNRLCNSVVLKSRTPKASTIALATLH